MVCTNDEQQILIWWDDKTIYGFIVEPTKSQKKLLNAVNKLPIIYRRVLILYAFEGMQRQQIAALMQESISTIRSLIHQSGLLVHDYVRSKAKGKCLPLQKCVMSNWPYMEYAKLVELRREMILWSRV
jgi:hypothetical protein